MDWPEPGGSAEIVPLARGVALPGHVEVSDGTDLRVRLVLAEYAEQLKVKPGHRVDVLWGGPTGGRSLPAEVTEIRSDPELRWSLQIIGPAEASQRRQSVRARVELPVVARCGAVLITGQTVDLSEAGARAWFDGWGLQPPSGTPMDVTLELGGGAFTAAGEVVRVEPRGPRWLISMKFPGLTEQEQDRLRRRVFEALRLERLRQAD
ncbi:flagellar brake protein [Geodermatophilus pulveris]|uniref:flagellar brake protein n=1 Tax=Geodermatophilus pulveris TaxID=1564159 RepID=UPI0015C5995F|nr:PilZ domain-containing protein [Geodermatophilus pulveris]